MTEVLFRQVILFELKMTPGPIWRRALDYVQGPRLLRIQVTDSAGKPASPKWGTAGNLCEPDGSPTNPPKDALLLCCRAPMGALIGKLGGSSADQPDTSPNAPPYGNKKVFAVGTYCVIALAKDDSGPLFLTKNEVLDSFKDDMGSLWILIEEATT